MATVSLPKSVLTILKSMTTSPSLVKGADPIACLKNWCYNDLSVWSRKPEFEFVSDDVFDFEGLIDLENLGVNFEYASVSSTAWIEHFDQEPFRIHEKIFSHWQLFDFDGHFCLGLHY